MRKIGIDNKTNNVFKYAVIAVISAVLIALAALCSLAPRRKTFAEGNKTLVIHVYDATQSYDKIAGWVWLENSEGKEYEVSAQAADDEQFAKEYELNGKPVTNKAHTITVTFSEEEITKTPKVGFLICCSTGNSDGTFWSRYEKETADIFVNTSALFAESDTAHVYYVRKDNVVYTNLEEAKMALEKITAARFTSTSAVEFECTSPITATTKVTLYNGETELKTVNAKPESGNAFKGTASFTGFTFDYSADYRIKVGDIPSQASVSKSSLIDDIGFINIFETPDVQKMEYGAIYTKEKTTFRLWAPFASAVKLKLYETDLTETPIRQEEMKHAAGTKWNGVWETEIEGDIEGVYYTYAVNNGGSEVETIDPYARSCGMNGARGMVVDPETSNPDGWDKDTWLYKSNAANADLPIIWELHVKDFSSSPDSGMVNKGKYLAFTETGTTVPGTDMPTGVDYLKELGITYIHLNPVYDFGSIDEGTTSDINNRDLFNWGYDPQNYNIPEGSYSTNPSDGYSRVNEFKQMVMALHNAGIGVIMDVVYNHTYSTSNLAIGDVVPGYFYRTNKAGDFTNGSGCGNELASERTMVRKYIIDSILYWAQEYHIDGFRFDLMGVHDVVTMNLIREELDKLDGGNGKKLLMYGEPWTGDGADSNSKEKMPNDPEKGPFTGPLVKYSYHTRVNATKSLSAATYGVYAVNAGNKLVIDCYNGNTISDLDSRIAIFNGDGRDGIRGSSWDIEARQNGWIQGSIDQAGVTRGMIWGGNRGMSLPSQSVAYASVHDNFTLWDHLVGKSSGKETPLNYDVPVDSTLHKAQTVSAACLMSRGMSLFIAGEEMGRTKYGNHNSYNSPIRLNQIQWARQEVFKPLLEHYKKVIKIRKAYKDIFSYERAAKTNEGSAVDGDGIITEVVTLNGKTLKCVYNGTDYATTVSTSGYSVYVLNGNVNPTASGSVTVQPKCVVIMGTVSNSVVNNI